MNNLSEITTDPIKPVFACMDCYPRMLEIGFIYGMGSLVYNVHREGDIWGYDKKRQPIYKDGAYAILGSPGHGDYEILKFINKPIKKGIEFYPSVNFIPYRDTTDYIMILASKSKNKSVQSAIQNKQFSGYVATNFFLDIIAKLLKRWENKFGKVENFYNNEFMSKVEYVNSLKQRN